MREGNKIVTEDIPEKLSRGWPMKGAAFTLHLNFIPYTMEVIPNLYQDS